MVIPHSMCECSTGINASGGRFLIRTYHIFVQQCNKARSRGIWWSRRLVISGQERAPSAGRGLHEIA